ncbi:MAG TPA: shufflon system plasmid conjugative transfer pilus tip adhesin PilV, partial [Noviherbaspirillum sp.]
MITKHSQQGMTLIEVLGALAITVVLLLSLTAMIDASMDDTKEQQAALHQEQVVNAANKYINNTENYAALVGSTSDGSVATITLAQLKTGGFLSDGFSNTNVFNQTPCILVRQSSSGKLDALVATYGGQAIPD